MQAAESAFGRGHDDTPGVLLCGQLRLACEGEPTRVSICHCLDCQRRAGSVFGVQARFRREQVTAIEGRATPFARLGDSGNPITFHFCPVCGSTVYWELGGAPELVAVAVGAFADPGFPAPLLLVADEVDADDVFRGVPDRLIARDVGFAQDGRLSVVRCALLDHRDRQAIWV